MYTHQSFIKLSKYNRKYTQFKDLNPKSEPQVFSATIRCSREEYNERNEEIKKVMNNMAQLLLMDDAYGFTYPGKSRTNDTIEVIYKFTGRNSMDLDTKMIAKFRGVDQSTIIKEGKMEEDKEKAREMEKIRKEVEEKRQSIKKHFEEATSLIKHMLSVDYPKSKDVLNQQIRSGRFGLTHYQKPTRIGLLSLKYHMRVFNSIKFRHIFNAIVKFKIIIGRVRHKLLEIKRDNDEAKISIHSEKIIITTNFKESIDYPQTVINQIRKAIRNSEIKEGDSVSFRYKPDDNTYEYKVNDQIVQFTKNRIFRKHIRYKNLVEEAGSVELLIEAIKVTQVETSMYPPAKTPVDLARITHFSLKVLRSCIKYHKSILKNSKDSHWVISSCWVRVDWNIIVRDVLKNVDLNTLRRKYKVMEI